MRRRAPATTPAAPSPLAPLFAQFEEALAPRSSARTMRRAAGFPAGWSTLEPAAQARRLRGGRGARAEGAPLRREPRRRVPVRATALAECARPRSVSLLGVARSPTTRCRWLLQAERAQAAEQRAFAGRAISIAQPTSAATTPTSRAAARRFWRVLAALTAVAPSRSRRFAATALGARRSASRRSRACARRQAPALDPRGRRGMRTACALDGRARLVARRPPRRHADRVERPRRRRASGGAHATRRDASSRSRIDCREALQAL